MSDWPNGRDPQARADLYKSSLESSKLLHLSNSDRQMAVAQTDSIKFAQLSEPDRQMAVAQTESIKLFHSNHLLLVPAPDADTIVFIGAPPKQSDQTDQAYAQVARHFDKVYKVCSRNLLNLGSAKIEKLLAPSSQFRVERRLKNEGILLGKEASGAKYLLDLRPASEDDEAIFLITELSCSKGVLQWYKAQKKYDIPRTLVSGQDDSSLLPTIRSNLMLAAKVTKIKKQTKQSKTTPEPPADSSAMQLQEEGESSKTTNSSPKRIGNWEGVFPTAPIVPGEAFETVQQTPATEDVDVDQEHPELEPSPAADPMPTAEPNVQPVYSQLRHWSAIERLLHAIEGHDPMLDSAPKMWTFFAVAKYFGCAHNERISGWIMTWLFTAPNHNFIQCNPEVSYRIGLGIQSEALIKDAFSLLVGEKVLMNVHNEKPAVRSSNLQVSVAGRKLELLDDDELNRIDHAANIFRTRIQSKYDALIGRKMLWLEGSATFQRILNFVAHSSDESRIAHLLKMQIRNFVRSRILWVLARDYKLDSPETEQNPGSVQSFYPHASAHCSIYTKLNEQERIFSRLFWMTLRQEHLEIGENSVFTANPNNLSLPSTTIPAFEGWSKLAQEIRFGPLGGKLRMVDKKALYDCAANFQNILSQRYWNESARLEDWSQDEPHHIGNVAKTPASLMSPFKYLQVSRPKRARATGAVSDVAEGKRPRLASDKIHCNEKLAKGKKVELPIRTAPSHSENQPKATEGRETTPEATLPGRDKLLHVGARSPQMDKGDPIDDESDASSSGPETAQSLPRGPSEEKLGKQREEVELDSDPSFSAVKLLIEITQSMQTICEEVLLSAHFFQDDEVPTTLIDSLTCLSQKEWDCLPLWAGGNDDGSGGVFDGVGVPNLETGGFHADELSRNGYCVTVGSSNWSEINSTIGKASKEATDGTVSETATVQSLGDIDMDVRSLDDDDEEVSSARNAETVVNVGSTSSDDLDTDSEGEMGYDDDDGEDVENDAVAEEGDVEREDEEEAGWDECLV